VLYLLDLIFAFGKGLSWPSARAALTVFCMRLQFINYKWVTIALGSRACCFTGPISSKIRPDFSCRVRRLFNHTDRHCGTSSYSFTDHWRTEVTFTSARRCSGVAYETHDLLTYLFTEQEMNRSHGTVRVDVILYDFL